MEENAAFLVRWAEELFGGWATWLGHILPKCKAGYKSNVMSIVRKIEGLAAAKEGKRG